MLECGLRAVVLHNKEVVWNYYAEFTADCRWINTNTKWTSFETVKDPEFTIKFAKYGAIGFVSVVRFDTGSVNVDKQIEYPNEYKPLYRIATSNYSSNTEAFIELESMFKGIGYR